PAPRIKLWVVGGAQVQIPVVADQLQQIPNLFLALVVSPRIASDIPVWHLVAQPVPGAGNHADMGWLQSHLFVQFAEHGLFWGLAPVNATLRKLPTVGAYALPPEHLVLLVEQDDADVRPKAVPVK